MSCHKRRHSRKGGRMRPRYGNWSRWRGLLSNVTAPGDANSGQALAAPRGAATIFRPWWSTAHRSPEPPPLLALPLPERWPGHRDTH